MPMSKTEIETHIRADFPEAEIIFQDLAGDNNHWAVTIIDESFRNLNRVQQHQKVYATLGTKMGNELHAMSLKTKTPE